MTNRFKEKTHSYFHFGFSSILLAFVMICIVTFGVLSLITANSDYKLSRKVAEKTTGYYKAEESAYIELAQIDHALLELYDNSSSFTDYYHKLETYFSNSHGTFHYDGNQASYTWNEPITDSQILEITLLLTYPTGSEEHFYRIAGWKTVSTLEPDDNTTLKLMGD